MILLTVVIFTVVQDPEVLPSYSSNQGNEVFFRWEAIFLFSRMYVGSWDDMQKMRIIAERERGDSGLFKIILKKSQNMRYNACVILAEEYNFN